MQSLMSHFSCLVSPIPAMIICADHAGGDFAFAEEATLFFQLLPAPAQGAAFFPQLPGLPPVPVLLPQRSAFLHHLFALQLQSLSLFLQVPGFSFYFFTAFNGVVMVCLHGCGYQQGQPHQQSGQQTVQKSILHVFKKYSVDKKLPPRP